MRTKFKNIQKENNCILYSLQQKRPNSYGQTTRLPKNKIIQYKNDIRLKTAHSDPLADVRNYELS